MKSFTKTTQILTLTAVLMGMCSSAMALSTGTLIVSGTVAAIDNITITPNTTNNTSLPIAAGGAAINVASVAEQSNDDSGYTITASSLTNGFLVNQSATTFKTAYKVAYNGGTATTITTAPVTVKTVASLTGLTTNTSAVTVTVTALPNPVAGTYQDTLTLTIVAN